MYDKYQIMSKHELGCEIAHHGSLEEFHQKRGEYIVSQWHKNHRLALQALYVEKFARAPEPTPSIVEKSDGERIQDLVTVVTSLILHLNVPHQDLLLETLSATKEKEVK